MAGVATGAVLGVLFAPEKGSSMRRRFSKKSYDYTDELEEKFNDLIDNITEQFQTVVDEVNLMADNEILQKGKSKVR